MTKSNSVQSFWKRMDGMSKPVSLTYKEAGVFRTSCGGVASVIVFILFASWLTEEFIDVYTGDGSFSTSTRTVEVYDNKGGYPTYDIPEDQLLVTYSLLSRDP